MLRIHPLSHRAARADSSPIKGEHEPCASNLLLAQERRRVVAEPLHAFALRPGLTRFFVLRRRCVLPRGLARTFIASRRWPLFALLSRLGRSGGPFWIALLVALLLLGDALAVLFLQFFGAAAAAAGVAWVADGV